MFGSLAADQRSAGLNTAFCNTGNDFGNFLRNIFTASDVVQEEQRFCADTNNVIDTHSYRINTDGIVLIHEDGQLDLGAAAIGTGHQDRLFHTGNGQTIAAAKAAHIIQATLVPGPGNMLLHQFHSLVACCNINTGSRIAGGERILMIHI